MNHHNTPIFQMLLVTGIGQWMSLAAVESAVRIISMAVPAVLSVLVYLKSRKNNKKNKKSE